MIQDSESCAVSGIFLTWLWDLPIECHGPQIRQVRFWYFLAGIWESGGFSKGWEMAVGPGGGIEIDEYLMIGKDFNDLG